MSFGFGYGFPMFWSVGNLFILCGFIFIIGTIIIRVVRKTQQWNKDNNSPVLTVEGIVITKRQDISYSHTGNNNMNHSSHTNYYVTFEVESGDRMELHVSGSDYGMMVEGDCGRLTFQGSRFLSFQRQQ